MAVTRDARGDALAALLREVRYRPGSTTGGLPGVGHFAGFVRAGRETVAITTDTVGTKVLLAEKLGRWEEVGQDIVGVNVNDLAAVGARPLGLVDSLSIRRPDPGIFRALGKGIDRGLRAAGCGLLGGETAVVPDLVQHTDLGGTAIGSFPRGRRPVTGEKVRAGDLVVGLPARGFHSNGYTFIRRILREERVNLGQQRAGARTTLGRELLQPTRIYVRASEAVADLASVHGFAHVTGGGVRNLIRVNRQRRFVLDGWPVPSGLYGWLAETGTVSVRRLYQTFNMGIGFVVVLEEKAWPEIRRRLRGAGFADARPIGRIAQGTGVDLPHLGLRYEGYS